MYTVADLDAILNQELDPHNEEKVKEKMPTPWHGIIQDLFFASRVFESPLKRVFTKHGLLQAKVDWRVAKHGDLMKAIIKHLTLSCCDICIICGSVGYRRRGEPNSPSLCHPHYVEYINYLDGEIVYVPRGKTRKVFKTNVYQPSGSGQIHLPIDS